MKTVNFEGKSYQFPDDATDVEINTFLGGDTPTPPAKPEAAKLSADDRRAYQEALPGTPEGMKTREGIEKKYGGRDAFTQQFDPTGEFLGKKVMPVAMAATAGGLGASALAPGLAPALGETFGTLAPDVGIAARAALTSPAFKKFLIEMLKKGALGTAAGVGGALGLKASGARIPGQR